jgi:hypothetical protein
MNGDNGVMIGEYISLRDARATLKKKYTTKDEVLSDRMKVIEGQLLEELDSGGLTSMKTTKGIAFKTTRTWYWVPDWDAFKQFVTQHDVMELFEKRIHQANMRTFMEDNPTIVPPIAADSRYRLTIRRGTDNE